MLLNNHLISELYTNEIEAHNAIIKEGNFPRSRVYEKIDYTPEFVITSEGIAVFNISDSQEDTKLNDKMLAARKEVLCKGLAVIDKRVLLDIINDRNAIDYEQHINSLEVFIDAVMEAGTTYRRFSNHLFLHDKQELLSILIEVERDILPENKFLTADKVVMLMNEYWKYTLFLKENGSIVKSETKSHITFTTDEVNKMVEFIAKKLPSKMCEGFDSDAEAVRSYLKSIQ